MFIEFMFESLLGRSVLISYDMLDDFVFGLCYGCNVFCSDTQPSCLYEYQRVYVYMFDFLCNLLNHNFFSLIYLRGLGTTLRFRYNSTL